MKKICVILFYILVLNNSLFSQTPKKFKKTGDDFLKEKNYIGAIDNYSKANDLEPNNYDVLYNRALCYEYTKEPQKAIADLKICNIIKNKEKDVYLKIATLYMLLNEYDNAITYYDKLLAFDKTNIEALQKSGWCHFKLNQYDRTIAKMEIAMIEDSRSEVSYYYAALAKDSLKDYGAAIQLYKKAIMAFKNQAKPKNPFKAYFTNLGVVLHKTKQYTESIENFDLALSADEIDTILPKNYMVYYLRSCTFLDKGEDKPAFNDINKAIKLEPNAGFLFYQRGIILKKTYQYNSAISDFTKCVLLDNKLTIGYFLKAQCLMELNNYKETIAECKKFLSVSVNDPAAVALLKDAEEKNYIANKESDPPIIKWFYPFVDQNNFINVYTNQVNCLLEGEISDKSLIKTITVNGKEMPFKSEDLNPQFKFKILTENLKRIELKATDIYGNTESKTVKVGKIVSDTRLIVNMEGYILSDDDSKTPLANKNIFLTNQKGEQFIASTTDEKGHFIFKNLPFDKDYLIEIEGEDNVTFTNKNFVLTDKLGKPVLKSTITGKNKFNFELLQTDFVALSLMEIDDVALTVNLSGKIFALMPEQTPIGNLTLQLIKSSGEILTKKTDDNGYFNFLNVSPGDSYSFKIDEMETKNINSSVIVITNNSGQIIKTINKNQYGYFEYKLLETEKTLLASISEPDPWLKITNLSAEKRQLEIIENIYYESGSATLPKEAEEILLKAIDAMKMNPKLTLEIESHTDAIAGTDFNLFLSQKRAANVADFMIQKGISAKRLIPKGMGETMIANHCFDGVDCSDGEHRLNRRTVFKLSYN
jgi:tetratricopeptide (TPR) repeat protein/outer membrane protein OmpA-like peptidoglycan-associated protein